jgi:hypothetical protein
MSYSWDSSKYTPLLLEPHSRNVTGSGCPTSPTNTANAFKLWCIETGLALGTKFHFPGNLWALGKWEGGDLYASSASGTGSWGQPHSVWPSGWRREACERSQAPAAGALDSGPHIPKNAQDTEDRDVTQICQMWEPAWVMADDSLRNVLWVICVQSTGRLPCHLGLEALSLHTRNPQVH